MIRLENPRRKSSEFESKTPLLDGVMHAELSDAQKVQTVRKGKTRQAVAILFEYKVIPEEQAGHFLSNDADFNDKRAYLADLLETQLKECPGDAKKAGELLREKISAKLKAAMGNSSSQKKDPDEEQRRERFRR